MSFNYSQPYIVVGALIVRDGKLLLVKENHFPDKGKWNIPAGKLDYGEGPNEAVIREVYGGTGLTFSPDALMTLHSVLRNDVPGGVGSTHVLRIVYIGTAEGEVTNAHSQSDEGEPEIAEFAWMSPGEVLDMDDSELRYHDIKDYAGDYVSGNSLPLDALAHFIQG